MTLEDEEELKCKGCGNKVFNIDTYIGFNYIMVTFGLSSGEVVHKCTCVRCGRKYMFSEV